MVTVYLTDGTSFETTFEDSYMITRILKQKGIDRNKFAFACSSEMPQVFLDGKWYPKNFVGKTCEDSQFDKVIENNEGVFAKVRLIVSKKLFPDIYSTEKYPFTFNLFYVIEDDSQRFKGTKALFVKDNNVFGYYEAFNGHLFANMAQTKYPMKECKPIVSGSYRIPTEMFDEFLRGKVKEGQLFLLPLSKFQTRQGVIYRPLTTQNFCMEKAKPLD
jgi:hypothetical protein